MKHTKRIAALLLALALCFSCAACSKTVGSYRVVKTLGTEQFRIGFRDGDQAAVYVNAALKVLAADGTIHSLALKWFGTDNTTFDSDANALDALGDIPQRTFIMGLNEERFPMSYADGDGYSGFDVELAQAVCARLGWTLQYQPISNQNAYVELSSGNVDCAWGGMVLDQTDSKDSKNKKKQKMTLTAPYLENELQLIVRGDSKYRTAGSLKGTTVLLGTDETYMTALSTDEKLMKAFGAAQRVTGGSKACFEALSAGDRHRGRQYGARLLYALTVWPPARGSARAAFCAAGCAFSPRSAKRAPAFASTVLYWLCPRLPDRRNFFTRAGRNTGTPMSNSNNKYKTLVSNTMLISLGTFGSKLLVFFMVRFYTSYLTPADYGTADLITQTANLLFPLISLGITDGVFRFAVDHTEQRRNIFSVGVYTILAGAVLLVAILPLLGLFPQFDGFLWLIALYTMCSCFHSLCAQFVRAEGHTALYAVQGMINTVLVIGLNVFFLVGLHMGITGYVLSVALADLACTLLLFVRERLWRQLMLRPGWAAAREMLAYSIPMIPTTVFWWITSVSDRYMVTAYLGVDANGIYAVSYKMPTILSLVSSIFMEAWQFSAVSEAQGSRREHIRFFSKVWCSFQSVMFLAGACIIAFAVPEIHVLTTEQYYGAWLYVPVLGMAMVFSAFVSYLGSVYMVEKCSKRTFVTSMIGALLNIALNFLLIPSKLGVQGAAIATCVSYFVVFVIRAVDARKFIPFRFYVVGVTENCILLTVQTLFIVLQLPGWKIAQAVCILLLLLLNRKPLLDGAGKIVRFRR